MKSFIEAGAAGVHFEDQLSSEKKCGHLGGKVLIPTSQLRPHARLRAARGRRARRADGARRPHRRALRDAAHERRRRARPRVPDGRAHARGLLPHPARHRGADRASARLRAVRRSALVRDLDARPRRGRRVRRGRARAVPGQAARVQLLAVVQLAEAPGRQDDRVLPAGARGHGLPVPVRDPGGLPRGLLVDVRPRARATRTGA